jgi:polysaccharide biosynthesis protein PslH
MFLARPPGPPMTGRKAVINTAIAALLEEKHHIDLFVLANDAHRGREAAHGRRRCAERRQGRRGDAAERRSRERRSARRARGAFWLGTPPKPVVLYNAGLSLLGGGFSLNEALFRSRELLAQVRQLRHAYDFAIADTIRTAPYANELGVPWHLDLDDLFSARYEKYLEQPDQLSAGLVLGYYRDSAPRAASALPKGLLRRLLKNEAACLRRREVFWARKATTVSLVSPDEAESFSRVAARQVHSLPMSVHIPAGRWSPGKAIGAKGAFLGGLDYKPNLDALLYYQHKIFPLLKAVSGVTPTLSHIGKCPADVRTRFLPGVVNFEGYVTDVAPRLSDAAFFVAPIVSGTGIKTKVLEAMALGLPVLGTRHAVSGLQIEHKNHCFVCERPAEFAEGMQYLSNPEVAEQMSLNARKYVEANFSIDVLRQRWSEVIHALALSQAQ